MFKKKNTQREDIMSKTGGKPANKNDVETEQFLIEANTPKRAKSKFAISAQKLDKVYERSYSLNKRCGVMAFRFYPGGNNFFVLSENQFLEYMRLKTESK